MGQRREPVGRGEVAGDVHGDEEEVGVLRAHGRVVPQKGLVQGDLGGEEVARAPRVGGEPVSVEAAREVVDVDPDGGGRRARGFLREGAGLVVEEGGGPAEEGGSGGRGGGEEEGEGEREPDEEEEPGGVPPELVGEAGGGC